MIKTKKTALLQLTNRPTKEMVNHSANIPITLSKNKRKQIPIYHEQLHSRTTGGVKIIVYVVSCEDIIKVIIIQQHAYMINMAEEEADKVTQGIYSQPTP